MINRNNLNIKSWNCSKVFAWLRGLSDDICLFDEKLLLKSNICGKKLLLVSAYDLKDLNILQVDHQEAILDAISMIKRKVFDYETETVQSLILQLSCLARELQNKLSFQIQTPSQENVNDIYSCVTNENSNIINNNIVAPTITISNNTNSRGRNSNIESIDQPTVTSLRNNLDMKDDDDRVSIDTLTRVSKIVSIVDLIVNQLNTKPFTLYCHYRTMKSLLVAISIELTSTAQRDQFVDKPNEVIEKCVKSLANYCDKILFGRIDSLFIQPFCLEFIQLKRDSNLVAWNFSIRSESGCHYICTLGSSKNSPAVSNKQNNTNQQQQQIDDGDEIIQINDQVIIGWTESKVSSLFPINDVITISLVLRKPPRESQY